MEGDYYRTKESVAQYISMAEGFNGKELIDQLRPLLPSGANLLELGSGPGSDWKILSEHFKVVGSDFSAEFLTHLRSAHPDGAFLELDAMTIDTDMVFDGIYSNKVLIHLSDEELKASISRQSEVLQPQGIVCHSFWKGEEAEVFKGMLVNYQTEADLEALFEPHFDPLVIEVYKEFEDGDSLLFIGRKR